MKKFSVFIILLMFSLSFNAQVTPSECFKNIQFDRTFLALNTHGESDLVSWYQKVFGMKVIKKFESEDKSILGIILQKNNLYLEILHYREIRKDTSDPEKKVGSGIKKVGFFVDQPVEKLKECLQSRNIKAGRIFHDRQMGLRFLHLKDPEGNELEIISKE